MDHERMAHIGRPRDDGSSYDWKPAFLAALAEWPVVAQAARIADVHTSTVYLNRKNDPEFAQAMDAAIEDGVDKAEAEAFRRAVIGVDEPVIHRGELSYLTEVVTDAAGNVVRDERGEVCTRLIRDAKGNPIPLTTRKYSDTLMVAYLKGRRKVFATERTELTGRDGGPVLVDETARAARAAQLLALAKQRAEADSEPEDDA